MRRWISALFATASALGTSAAAYGNGAFPDSESIITPADRPQEILLVTNFGLVSSTDGAKTWLWSCEQPGNALGTFYQLTPAPKNRLFAVANQNVAYSDDSGCSWQAGGGAVTGQSITDAYLDPVSGTRLFAIAVANQSYSLYQSTDTGMTFAPATYQTPVGVTMAGVESARSDPNVVYVSLRTADGMPQLARSSDGGAHFTVHDLSADLGPGLLLIIAVDPQDPNRVLFRLLSPNDQSIALTVDGGASATKPVTVNGNFNSFVRLPSGTILVSGLVQFSTAPGLFRSHDRGSSFEMVASPPAIRALAQRAGTVYAAADNFGDGYAIGTSTDEGTTWQSFMVYSDVNAINPCLKTYCQDTCGVEVSMTIWPAEVCAADAPVSTGTAGRGGGTGQGGAGAGGSSGTGGTGGPPPPKHGGGCGVAGSPGARSAAVLLLAIAAALRRRAPATALGRAGRPDGPTPTSGSN